MAWRRRLELLVLAAAILVGGVGVKANTPPASRTVYVDIQRPCRLYWSSESSPELVELFYSPLDGGSRVAEFPAGSPMATIPDDGQTITILAIGNDFLQEWNGTSDLGTGIFNTKISLHVQLNHRTVTLLVFAGLLAVVGALWRLRKQRLLDKLQEAHDDEPLIRSDGQLPRRLIGGYKPVAQLGAGAMGVVYRALAPDGMQVAIKVPAPHLISDADYKARFRREIQLGLSLTHPRVVRMLAMPDGDDSYIVLELVRGSTLEGVARKSPGEELARVRRWLDQSLDALAYIHSQGVIHRDLKPANLMVLPDDTIKLMDFGIAHKMHGTRLTGTDSILGTPVFMAPEQVMGQTVDERSDLFALGLIFYERLTGSLPYPDEMVELLRAKLTQPLPSLRDWNARVPADLERVIAKLTQLKPNNRYASAEEARRDLGAR
jgi:hypothetical protein